MNPSVDNVYDSTKTRSSAISELQELWRYRDLLWLLVITSIKSRYKRSTLGIFWTLLNPLLNTIVLSTVFSFFFSRFGTENYPVYILSGLLLWNFFSQTTLHAMNRLVWGSSLIKRIYIPRTIFAISVVGNSMVNLLLGFIPLLLVILLMGPPLSLSMISIPLSIILLALYTLGVTLLMSTIAVYFVDIVDMFSIILSIWFYLTPIIYPESIVPSPYNILLRLNPIYYLLEIFRAPLYAGIWPDPTSIGIALVVSLSIFLIGWFIFTNKADDFAYRI